MRYFTLTVTCWKHPCDLGVTAAVKNIYRFLTLKDVRSFYQLYSESQQLLNEEGSKFLIGSIGVCYSRPATLLDVANYAKEKCNKVIDEIIKNTFIKADFRISFGSTVTEMFDNNKLLKFFKNLNITATAQDINELVAINE